MIKVDDIKQLVEQAIEGSDMFVVAVTVSTDNRIEVDLDRPTGICIDDCATVSRFIENALDRDEEDFELIVASAGIGQPFKVPQQYQKNIGKEVEVLLRSGIKRKGILQNAANDEITLEYEVQELAEGKKRKQAVVKSDTIRLDDIKSTKLLLYVR